MVARRESSSWFDVSVNDLPPDPPVPQLRGRRVDLVPVGLEHYEQMFALCSSPTLGYQWRQAPGTIRPHEFPADLWKDVFSQFAVTHTGSGDVLGLVVCYQMDVANRTAYFATLFDPAVHKLGWPLEAIAVFVRYLFEAFNLRKLYAEAVDYNLRQYASVLRRYAHIEGCLRGHTFVGGEYRDVYLLALYPEDWVANG